MAPKRKIQSWVRYKPKEAELLIVKFAKEEKTASEIGLILRDTYGIPSVKKLCGKQVSTILAEKKLAKTVPDGPTNSAKTHVSFPLPAPMSATAEPSLGLGEFKRLAQHVLELRPLTTGKHRK